MEISEMLLSLGQQNGDFTSLQLQKALMVQNACLLRIANPGLSASDAIQEVLKMYREVSTAFTEAREGKE